MKKKSTFIIAGTLAAVVAASGGIMYGGGVKPAWAAASGTTAASPTAKPVEPDDNKQGGDASPHPDRKPGQGRPGDKGSQGDRGGKDGIDCNGASGTGDGRGDRPDGGTAEKSTPGPTPTKNATSTATPTPTSTPSANAASVRLPANNGYTVVISGGFDTDPQDHGRPDVLIAAALGVPTEVFREAFSGVTPAGLDSGGPSEEQARSNKAALLKVLEPYGITNDRLDEVSNYYRYNASRGESWPVTPAVATAIVKDGVVTGVTITNPGSGYSSTPTVTITGPNGTVAATAKISYSTDFKTNGSLAAITLAGE